MTEYSHSEFLSWFLQIYDNKMSILLTRLFISMNKNHIFSNCRQNIQVWYIMIIMIHSIVQIQDHTHAIASYIQILWIMGSANRFMSYSFDLASGHPKCVFDYMSLFFFQFHFQRQNVVMLLLTPKLCSTFTFYSIYTRFAWIVSSNFQEWMGLM